MRLSSLYPQFLQNKHGTGTQTLRRPVVVRILVVAFSAAKFAVLPVAWNMHVNS